MAESLPKIKKLAFSALAIIGALAILWFAVALLFGLSTKRQSTVFPGSSGGLKSPLAVENRSFLGIQDSYFGSKSVEIAGDGKSGSVGEGALTRRKVVKNGSLSLLVKKAEEVAESIKGIAARLGGFVGDARVYEVSSGVKSGTVTIRVPADRFDEAVREIKKLAVKVENESINAQDVTEQFVDLEARLKNAKAEEEQYLEIMKKSWAVADTIQVAQRLAEVRGRIEGLEGQLQFLSRQVDMSTITATLTAEADVEVFGIRWRPLYVAKQSLRRMLTGIADYVDAMIAFVFALPVIALWLGTIAVVLFIVWKAGKWIWRKFAPRDSVNPVRMPPASVGGRDRNS